MLTAIASSQASERAQQEHPLSRGTAAKALREADLKGGFMMKATLLGLQSGSRKHTPKKEHINKCFTGLACDFLGDVVYVSFHLNKYLPPNQSGTIPQICLHLRVCLKALENKQSGSDIQFGLIVRSLE